MTFKFISKNTQHSGERFRTIGPLVTVNGLWGRWCRGGKLPSAAQVYIYTKLNTGFLDTFTKLNDNKINEGHPHACLSLTKDNKELVDENTDDDNAIADDLHPFQHYLSHIEMTEG